MKTQGMS